jgi:hypothetical protein
VNLTLSIDQRTLEKARAAAHAMGLSVNEMVRRYLEQLAGEGDPEASFQEFRDLSLNGGGHSGGRRWSREDLHRG